jgi:hypothetical protein
MLWTAVASLLWTIVLLVAALSLLRLNAIRLSYRRPRHAAVVVLGDIGRSPRMMNHAESLANLGFTVSLVGYASCTRLPHNPGERPWWPCILRPPSYWVFMELLIHPSDAVALVALRVQRSPATQQVRGIGHPRRHCSATRHHHPRDPRPAAPPTRKQAAVHRSRADRSPEVVPPGIRYQRTIRGILN